MDIRDSQRIKQVCDNAEKMADAFNRIADALERLIEPKHGKWIEVDHYWKDNEYTTIIECSTCKEQEETTSGLYKYCPNCGAKMKGTDVPNKTYEEGMADAWKIAQTVFGSTVTLYEAMDVVKCMKEVEDDL